MDHKTKPGSPTEVLEHFGVKGMRWGVRGAGKSGGASRTPKYDKLRDAEKARKYQASLDRNKEIDAARERLYSGQLHKDYQQAKADYKVQKKEVGRRAAKKVLRAKRQELDKVYEKSQEWKSGSETTAGILLAVGSAIFK